jgi:hypothetical protein
MHHDLFQNARACPGKVGPLFRQGHASQVFELARILFDQVIPPDRKARKHIPEKWVRFSDKDMLPEFLNWREFFSIR